MKTTSSPFRKYINKYKYLSIFLIIILFFAASPLMFESGLSNPEPIEAYLNGVFPTKTPTGDETVETSYGLENAFPNITFIDPVDMVELPGGEEFIVIGLQGHIWKVANDPLATEKELLLDITENVVVDADGGMLGVVLHPEYGQVGSPNAEYIYVFYRFSPDPEFNNDFSGALLNGYINLSRFSLPAGATTIDPASEEVLIRVFDRSDWHNGGDMFFGPEDGFLYLSLGDEGGVNDAFNVTQQIDKYLYAGILRIDVDKRGGDISHPIRRQPQNTGELPEGDVWVDSFTQNYYIPNDNPWLDESGGILEEFYAIGTRSPHRMDYDAATGNIWVADVGQNAMEEISIVNKGDNLQWPYMEGTIEGAKDKPAVIIGNEKGPIYAYGRDIGRSIIGGLLYRGTRHPEITGKYFFGDHETQNVWMLDPESDNVEEDIEFLFLVPVEGVGNKDGVSSFYVDSDEHIYVLDLFGTNTDGGVIHRVVRNAAVPDPPQNLSDLGVFTNLETLETVPGIIPYDVNTPLWSDGAEKRRWIALPNDGEHNEDYEKISYETEENWRFPAGTVLIKHFELPTDENDPSAITKLETRFAVFTENGDMYAVTYKWNEEGTDAVLVGINEAPTQDYEITKSDGTIVSQTWEFPSRQQCIQCHNSVAGYALGLKTRQLNKDYEYPSTGIIANQLLTWSHLGMFNTELVDASQIPTHTSLDNANSSVEMRVRSYIDSNCAYCHRPNGVESAFDGRSLMALYDQNMINGIVESHASIPGDIILDPGNIENSVIWQRDISTADNRMPPVGRTLIDQEYIGLLEEYISTLNTSGPANIENGWHNLQVKQNELYVTVDSLQEDTQLTQNTLNNADNQKWYLQNMEGNKYRIMSGYSDKVMSLQDLRADKGVNVVQETWTGAQQQLWYFILNDEGDYSIRNVYSGLYLDVYTGENTEDLHFITEEELDQDHQKFSVLEAEEITNCTELTTTQISDLTWVSATTGAAVIGINTNIFENNQISINGQTYTSGIATHAISEIVYQIDNQYTFFKSDIGVDDSTASANASIMFEVVGDGVTLYQSPTMGSADDAISIAVNVLGVSELKLIVNDVPEESPNNTISNDHADWANARLENCEKEGITLSNEMLTGGFENPESIRIYPNPISKNELLTLNIDLNINEDVDVIIYDILGRVLEQQNVLLENRECLIQFETSKYSSGFYFMRINGKSGSQTKQFIVN